MYDQNLQYPSSLAVPLVVFLLAPLVHTPAHMLSELLTTFAGGEKMREKEGE